MAKEIIHKTSIIENKEIDVIEEKALLRTASEQYEAYTKLNKFLKEEYLPNSRDSIGIQDIPNGKKYYEYLTRYYTTTNLTPEEIHNIGLAEIKRIRSEMEEQILQFLMMLRLIIMET